MKSLDQVSIASRAFCLAALVGIGVTSRDEQVGISLIVIATLATTAVYVSLATSLPTAVVVAVEAVLTALVIGLALPGGVFLLPYIVVLALIGGVSRGVVGVSATVLAEFVTFWLVTVSLIAPPSRTDVIEALGPWLFTSIGAGLLGAWVRHVGRIPEAAASQEAYESARRLLTQLRTVARRLSTGLDPVTLSGELVSIAQERLGAYQAGVFLRREGGLLCPQSFTDDTAREQFSTHPLVSEDWTETEPLLVPVDVAGERTERQHLAVLPLRAGSRIVGVLLAHLPAAPPPGTLQEVMRDLDDHSFRLDTALVFDEVRSIATAEERRRLAREIHDGVAQEVVSMGYEVDDLLAQAESPTQKQKLLALRAELTRVVGELRLSIFDLRSDVLAENGLGAALSDHVRQVGSRSAMTVHLTLDEAPTRLRPETEAELLRIAQEAITNARKHSGAENLWVNCRVRPPYARLEVRDDGRGLSQRRADSFGLGIMKERADRLDARLEVARSTESPGHGTVVRVTLGPELGMQESESGYSDDRIHADQRFVGGRS
jgi:signal transduction histidine kinase